MLRHLASSLPLWQARVSTALSHSHRALSASSAMPQIKEEYVKIPRNLALYTVRRTRVSVFMHASRLKFACVTHDAPCAPSLVVCALHASCHLPPSVHTCCCHRVDPLMTVYSALSLQHTRKWMSPLCLVSRPHHFTCCRYNTCPPTGPQLPTSSSIMASGSTWDAMCPVKPGHVHVSCSS